MLHSHDWAPAFTGLQICYVSWSVDRTPNSSHCIQTAALFFFLSSPNVTALFKYGASLAGCTDLPE